MPDIRHAILIEATPAKIYQLVSTGPGMSQWWAADASEDSTSRMVELGFFNRSTTYRLKPVRLSEPTDAEWLCETGKEWSGTTIRFRLMPNQGRTLVRFEHLNWLAETDYFTSCNTTWGGLMFRLKSAAEGKASGPLFSATGMAY
jgi:uncharacterized protein YndB with AHSA1/START domain